MFTIRGFTSVLLIFLLGRSASSCARHEVDRVVQVTAGPWGEFGPRCSPDGRYLAFEYFSPEHPAAVQMWLMPKQGQFSDARPLLGYTGDYYGEFSWSPDAGWLSFVRGVTGPNGVISDQVFKINVANREVVQLTNFPADTDLGGTSWSQDGRILFEMNNDLYVVPETGGAVTKLVDMRSKLPGVTPVFPSWSPDGSRVAFVERGGSPAQPDRGHDLYVVDLRSGTISKILGGLGDDAPFWLDQDKILCSRVEQGPRSSIWIASVSGATPQRLTKGFFDMSPAVCPDRSEVYIARNMSISRSRSITEGFHIWSFRIKGTLRSTH